MWRKKVIKNKYPNLKEERKILKKGYQRVIGLD